MSDTRTVRLTPHCARVLATLRTKGPMRAGRLGHLLFPNVPRARAGGTVGGALGRLQRAGLVAWSARSSEYFVIAAPGVVVEELKQ